MFALMLHIRRLLWISIIGIPTGSLVAGWRSAERLHIGNCILLFFCCGIGGRRALENIFCHVEVSFVLLRWKLSGTLTSALDGLGIL